MVEEEGGVYSVHAEVLLVQRCTGEGSPQLNRKGFGSLQPSELPAAFCLLDLKGDGFCEGHVFSVL